MVNENGTFSFSDVKLVSTNGKFYFETSKNRNRVYEVPHDVFRNLLVTAANAKATGLELPNKSNSFEYLFNQLELTEDLFTALMYDNSKWRH